LGGRAVSAGLPLNHAQAAVSAKPPYRVDDEGQFSSSHFLPQKSNLECGGLPPLYPRKLACAVGRLTTTATWHCENASKLA
jgi:hypothetical protein